MREAAPSALCFGTFDVRVSFCPSTSALGWNNSTVVAGVVNGRHRKTVNVKCAFSGGFAAFSHAQPSRPLPLSGGIPTCENQLELIAGWRSFSSS